MKTYPKELIDEFNATPLYVCTRCGHTESEIPTRSTGCGDWDTPDGDEEYCPECEGKETMVEATIDDYICLLEEEGVDINDYN